MDPKLSDDATDFWHDAMEEIIRIHTGSRFDSPSPDDSVKDDETNRPVQVTRTGTTAWITLNRPTKGNAMNPAMNRAMIAALDETESDPRVRVVVIRGAGGNFSTGMDIKEYVRDLDQADPCEQERAHREALAWQYDRLISFSKPTVAMVEGYCVGAAFTVVLACDVCITADEAQFVLSEVNWGALPAGLVMYSVAQTLPARQALLYALTGRPFDGRQAEGFGLATTAVAAESLKQETMAVAEELASKSPATLHAIKAAFHQCHGMNPLQARDYLQAKFDQLRSTDPAHTCNVSIDRFIAKQLRPALVSSSGHREKPTPT